MLFICESGDKELYLLALFGEHSFMLGNKIIGEVFSVQVTGEIGYLAARFVEIFQRLLKKLVVIGLETYLALGLQNSLILHQLAGVGKSALVVLAPVPRVAEVYVYPVHAVFSSTYLELFNSQANFTYLYGALFAAMILPMGEQR